MSDECRDGTGWNDVSVGKLYSDVWSLRLRGWGIAIQKRDEEAEKVAKEAFQDE